MSSPYPPRAAHSGGSSRFCGMLLLDKVDIRLAGIATRGPIGGGSPPRADIAQG
jgi:hypothetical protein